MPIAIYPGSFDPIHLGHLDIVRRAMVMFDKLFVAVVMSSVKKPMFPSSMRMALAEEAITHEVTPNTQKVEVVAMEGLMVDLAVKLGASVVVRGLRGPADMDYEQKMAFANHALEQLDTCFLVSPPDLSILSSSLIREVVRLGRRKAVMQWIPSCIHEDVVP